MAGWRRQPAAGSAHDGVAGGAGAARCGAGHRDRGLQLERSPCGDWRAVQRFGEPLSAPCQARLAGLRSGGSTRLGAAIRHGARELARRPDGERVLLVISDGQPHDIDVHDPRYLVEDARQAVRSARRQGLTVRWLALDAASAPARRIFGAPALR
ncbi:VWA domain-containing protein [Piscinibacter aquaticus]|uniref:VWA domain-containing protein n=1 Tax=Piscinibacter aquaticus TaxID=392597 RepID=A0A5C6U2P8_9BURK|nr:VWA domain-containing protein [Piscinibacter aquaticus]